MDWGGGLVAGGSAPICAEDGGGDTLCLLLPRRTDEKIERLRWVSGDSENEGEEEDETEADCGEDMIDSSSTSLRRIACVRKGFNAGSVVASLDMGAVSSGETDEGLRAEAETADALDCVMR